MKFNFDGRVIDIDGEVKRYGDSRTMIELSPEQESVLDDVSPSNLFEVTDYDGRNHYWLDCVGTWEDITADEVKEQLDSLKDEVLGND